MRLCGTKEPANQADVPLSPQASYADPVASALAAGAPRDGLRESTRMREGPPPAELVHLFRKAMGGKPRRVEQSLPEIVARLENQRVLLFTDADRPVLTDDGEILRAVRTRLRRLQDQQPPTVRLGTRAADAFIRACIAETKASWEELLKLVPKAPGRVEHRKSTWAGERVLEAAGAFAAVVWNGVVVDPGEYVPLDGYALFSWSVEQSTRSENRPLTRVDEDSRPRVERFFSSFDIWRQRVESQRKDGPVLSLVGIEMSDLDSDKRLTFRLSATRYAECLATQAMFHDSPAARGKAEEILDTHGAEEFVRVSPPNLLFANVSVVCDENQLLALQRGGSTHDGRLEWTLGPCETLRRDDFAAEPNQAPRSLDALAERALLKELGLTSDDYGPIHVSWIGVQYIHPRSWAWNTNDALLPGAQIRMHALVRTRLSVSKIRDRAQTSAVDGFEHLRYEGVAWNEASLPAIMNAVIRGLPDDAGRRWLPFTGLAAREVHRFQSVLRTAM
jgi:hypothetical protein